VTGTRDPSASGPATWPIVHQVLPVILFRVRDSLA
jgi:hypothetical protein